MIIHEFMHSTYGLQAAAERMLDVTQLRAALAVRDEGTVTRAAERLGLTQPSVSRLLSALEATLGYPLFERRRARLLLSDRGRLLLAEAERTLVALSRLADVGRELGRGGRGVLRIASIPALMQGLLPLAIEVFQLNAPDVLVELEEMLRGPMVRAVQQGTVDLGFASLPIGAQGMSIEAVAESEAVCLMPEGHDLARKRVIRAQDLEGVPLIAGRQETLLRQRVDDAFARVGQQPRIAIVADGTPLRRRWWVRAWVSRSPIRCRTGPALPVSWCDSSCHTSPSHTLPSISARHQPTA